MGCSSSISAGFKGKSLPFSPDIETETTTEEAKLLMQKVSCENGQSNGFHSMHINHTQIVIISKDVEKEAQQNDSENTEVSMHNNSEHHKKYLETDSRIEIPSIGSRTNSDTSLQRRTLSPRALRSQSLPGTIKGVLKTGRTDMRDQMIASRPIKTVTFVDSVTVLTVH